MTTDELVWITICALAVGVYWAVVSWLGRRNMRRIVNKNNTWVMAMVRLNEDEALVQRLRDALKKNGGCCPCMPQKSIETVCMCKDFRDKIKDPQFEGLCHCGLYRKVKEERKNAKEDTGTR